MKNIYHKHTSSNSYWDSHWYDEDYFLCETEEEYQAEIAKYKKAVEEYHTSGRAKMYGDWRFTISEENKIHATEFYYGHEWQGKTFDCIGVTYKECLERCDRTRHIIKPNTVTGLKECTDRGIGWMYGS